MERWEHGSTHLTLLPRFIQLLPSQQQKMPSVRSTKSVHESQCFTPCSYHRQEGLHLFGVGSCENIQSSWNLLHLTLHCTYIPRHLHTLLVVLIIYSILLLILYDINISYKINRCLLTSIWNPQLVGSVSGPFSVPLMETSALVPTPYWFHFVAL